MPKLEAYHKSLDYTYVLGAYPAHMALNYRAQHVTRLLIGNDNVESLTLRCAELGIRTESAERILRRESKKNNCRAALVMYKYACILDNRANHIVLHNTSDAGNLGTCLRSCLGFGFLNIAVIRPCVDIFDPHALRASMGAFFAMNVACFDNFDDYRTHYPVHALYPFMLDNTALKLSACRPDAPYALIFGNEGSGLPCSFTHVGTRVYIPQNPAIDSLNLSAAVAIATYELGRVNK